MSKRTNVVLSVASFYFRLESSDFVEAHHVLFLGGQKLATRRSSEVDGSLFASTFSEQWDGDHLPTVR